MKTFVILLSLVLSLVAVQVYAVDVDVHMGIKQVSIMEGAGEHFVVAGVTVSQDISDFKVYGKVMGDFANEAFDTDNHFRADGTLFEVGAVHKLGTMSDVQLTFTKDQPFTSMDTETIQLMTNIRF